MIEFSDTQFLTITSSELKNVRTKCLEDQHHRCAICGSDLGDDPTNQHVDHQHCLKSDPLGVNGNGLIRGVLCRNCNALEGKIWNNMRRFQACTREDPVNSRVKWLESLLKYYKINLQHKQKILHPSEKRKIRLPKSSYNKLKKNFYLDPKNFKRNGDEKPFPKYTGFVTPKLRSLSDQYLPDLQLLQ